MPDVSGIGFTNLSEGKGARNGSYRVNIVFVHGLGGHPKRTWEADRAGCIDQSIAKPSWRDSIVGLFGIKRSSATDTKICEGSTTSPNVLWPHEYLTEDIPEARVWTYGYNATPFGGLFLANNKNSISQHGRDLVVRIEREIENEDPIVFVAHSLGGILVKYAMCRSEKCRSRTKLIVFLGTPHRGSSSAGYSDILANLFRLTFQDMNKKVIEGLDVQKSEVLDNIHEEFIPIAHESGVIIHSFQEARGISGMRGLSNKVVDDFSSKVDLPKPIETVESVDANHMQMARCSDKRDPRYRAIVGVLKKHIRNGGLDQRNLRKRPRDMEIELHTHKRAKVAATNGSTNLVIDAEESSEEEEDDAYEESESSRGGDSRYEAYGSDEESSGEENEFYDDDEEEEDEDEDEDEDEEEHLGYF